MKIFRSLPTNRLLAVLALAVACSVAGVIAVAARGGGGATPPAKPIAAAIHDALGAASPAGITARIHFTNNLLPSSALTGQAGSALLGSADGRLWASDAGGRIELQSDGGDVQITWNDKTATVFDASSNTAYVFDLPASKSSDRAGKAPSLDEITTFLTDAAKHWAISGAEPANVAGQEAYTVRVSPKENGGLLGSVQAAWDAIHGTPLEIEVYAKGVAAPVLGLKATDVSYGAVAASAIDVTPPASAKVVDVSSQFGAHQKDPSAKPVVGLAAVTAAAPFAVVPDTVGGLRRTDVRLVGPSDARAVVAVYGEGLGSVLVVERKADPGAAKNGMLGALPTVNLDGRITHELATPLGTVLAWQWNGVSYVLAGSVTQASAEAAARAVR